MRNSLAVLLTAILYTGIAGAAEADWISLFNGKDLTGFEQKGGKATYKVEDGAIVGTTVPNTDNSFLCTTEHYGDFVLEFEFQGHPVMNSGVQFRSDSLDKYKKGRVHGYQCELEEEGREKRWSCGIYDEARRGWLYLREEDEGTEKDAAFTEQCKRLWKAGDWNLVRIEAKGDHIRTWLNGELRADLKDDMTSTGFIGLQVHGVGDKTEPMSVRWRNIRVQKLEGAAK